MDFTNIANLTPRHTTKRETQQKSICINLTQAVYFLFSFYLSFCLPKSPGPSPDARPSFHEPNLKGQFLRLMDLNTNTRGCHVDEDQRAMPDEISLVHIGAAASMHHA